MWLIPVRLVAVALLCSLKEMPRQAQNHFIFYLIGVISEWGIVLRSEDGYGDNININRIQLAYYGTCVLSKTEESI